MAYRERREVTHHEAMRLGENAEVRVDVETESTFDLVIFRIWSLDHHLGWLPTSNTIRLKAAQLPDFVRLGLRAHQSIQARKPRP